MTRGAGRLSRRALLAGAAAAGLLAATGARGQQPGGIFIVSRERILRDALAARRLREAEAEMTARLQSQIDATKERFAAEEEELARLRAELAAPAFEARVAEFDQRVRMARREAQERAAILQNGFQEARAVIVAALPPLMERLRAEAGALAILNADEVLAVDPSADLTERAIALFDAEGPAPPVPDLDLSQPLAGPPDEPRDGPAPAQPAPAR